MIDKDEYWGKELKAYDSPGRMSKQELKPCPFCGNKKSPWHMDIVPIYGGVRKLYAVACDCGVVGTEAPTKHKAAKYWNNRVNNEQR